MPTYTHNSIIDISIGMPVYNVGYIIRRSIVHIQYLAIVIIVLYS